jgi:hypothetical protein
MGKGPNFDPFFILPNIKSSADRRINNKSKKGNARRRCL